MSNNTFDINTVTLSRSWFYVDGALESQINALRKRCGAFDDSGSYPVLWSTRSKFVLLLTLDDGTKLVYKAPRKMRSAIRYIFRPGPWGQEAVNFALLEKVGLPLVKMVSAGETRNFFMLKSGFLMTEYAEGFSDGRLFTYKGELKDEKHLIDEFVRRNFQYLAKMHRAGFIHNGFTPPNLLFKIRTAPDADGNLLDLRWIDVASCEKVKFKIGSKTRMARDLSLFFRFFRFTDEEKLSFLATYCESNPDIGMTPEKLLEVIRKNPVR